MTVRDESVEDADRVDRLLLESQINLPDGGWTREAVADFLERLEREGPVQAGAIRVAAVEGGFVSRERVYELGGYPEERSLRGFTRPINRITQQLRSEGVLPENAIDIFWAEYNEDSPNVGWAAGFGIPDDVLPLFKG